jgi:hypothetical protein
MNYLSSHFRNMIMLSVNGLSIVAYAFVLDSLIKLFNIDSYSAHTLIVIGSIVAFLPLIIKIDVFEKRASWEDSHLIFWKKKEYKTTTCVQYSLLGILPIGEPREVNSEHSLDQPSIQTIGNDIGDTLRLASHFLPVINSYIDTAINIKKLASQPGQQK